MSAKALFMSLVLYPIRPTQYELLLHKNSQSVILSHRESVSSAVAYPTTVNSSPPKVNFCPVVLTKPVGVAVGVAAALDVDDGVDDAGALVGTEVAVPARH